MVFVTARRGRPDKLQRPAEELVVRGTTLLHTRPALFAIGTYSPPQPTNRFADTTIRLTDVTKWFANRTSRLVNTIKRFSNTTSRFADITNRFIIVINWFSNKTNRFADVTNWFIDTTSRFYDTTKWLQAAETSIPSPKASKAVGKELFPAIYPSPTKTEASPHKVLTPL